MCRAASNTKYLELRMIVTTQQYITIQNGRIGYSHLENMEMIWPYQNKCFVWRMINRVPTVLITPDRDQVKEIELFELIQ